MASYKQVIKSFEWGPSITQTIIDFGRHIEPGSVSAADFHVTADVESFDGTQTVMQTADRIVKDAYVTDSRFVTLEYKVGAEDSPPIGGLAIAGSSPFAIDMKLFRNGWGAPNHTITAKLGGETIRIPKEACTGRIMPIIDGLEKGASSYGGITLTYAAFTPEASCSAKRPLIIWLHGAGECGTDPDIALLGGNITAFMSETVQKYFENGAYVLVPQTPTVWMDAGKGQHDGTEPSIYTLNLTHRK